MFAVMEAKRSRRSWNGTNWWVSVAEGAIFGGCLPRKLKRSWRNFRQVLATFRSKFVFSRSERS
jgi:hypothetical protein